MFDTRPKRFCTQREVDELKLSGEFEENSKYSGFEIVSEADKARLDSLDRKIKESSKSMLFRKGRENENLVEQINRLKTTVQDARKEMPELSPFDALTYISHWDKIPATPENLEKFADIPATNAHIRQAGMGILIAFFNELTNAVLADDAAALRKVADALDEPIIIHEEEKLINSAHHAFYKLRQEGILFPTKKQVREAAVSQRALARYSERNTNKDALFVLNAQGEREFTPQAIKALQREEELVIGGQNWARFWKRAGLDSLAQDKGGYPARKGGKKRILL